MEQKSSRKEEKNLDINGRLLRGLLVISDKNRRARLVKPCPGRSRKYCTHECEWKLGWVWGTCKVADVLAFYVAELCDGDLLEASSANKVRDFAKSIGYLSKDFNERALRDVSKAEICRKISNDVETIREKIRDTLESKAPWNELGIDKNDYVEIRSQVVEDMKVGYSMKRLLDDAKKYATQENLVRAAKTAALVGTIVGVGLALGWAAGGEDAYDRGPPAARQVLGGGRHGPAVGQEDDAVGHSHGRRHVVRGHEHREAQAPVEIHQQLLDAPHVERIEAGEGLVAQHDLRIGHQRAGQSPAPAHASGELARVERAGVGKADGREPSFDLGSDVGFAPLRVLEQRQGHVLEDRHRVEERSMLEEHPDPVAHAVELRVAEPGDVLARNAHGARVGTGEPADDVDPGVRASSNRECHLFALE